MNPYVLNRKFAKNTLPLSSTPSNLNDLVAEAIDLAPFMTLVKEVNKGLYTSAGKDLRGSGEWGGGGGGV